MAPPYPIIAPLRKQHLSFDACEKQRPHGTSRKAGPVWSLQPTRIDRCPKESISVKTFLMDTRIKQVLFSVINRQNSPKQCIIKSLPLQTGICQKRFSRFHYNLSVKPFSSLFRSLSSIRRPLKKGFIKSSVSR